MDDSANTERHQAATTNAGIAPTVEERLRVAQEQDQAREELRQCLGVIEVSVNLVREARDE